MNANNAKDYLPLVQALADGRRIQYRPVSVANWIDVDDLTDAHPADRYRIKPEPREIWFNRNVNGHDRGDYSSREVAESYARLGDRQVCYREVIE